MVSVVRICGNNIYNGSSPYKTYCDVYVFVYACVWVYYIYVFSIFRLITPVPHSLIRSLTHSLNFIQSFTVESFPDTTYSMYYCHKHSIYIHIYIRSTPNSVSRVITSLARCLVVWLDVKMLLPFVCSTTRVLILHMYTHAKHFNNTVTSWSFRLAFEIKRETHKKKRNTHTNTYTRRTHAYERKIVESYMFVHIYTYVCGKKGKKNWMYM